MGIESGPSFSIEEAVDTRLSCEDAALEAALHDPDASRDMYETSPLLWIRVAVGADIGRGASEVSNRDLAEIHSAGGFAEWDPKIAKAVAQYLRSVGFVGLRGSVEAPTAA